MQSILITGASTGIGRALAVQLLKDGHKVWGVARNEGQLKQLASYLGSKQFYFSSCDVRQPADLQNLKSLLETKGFEPDVIILNAGVTSSDAQANHQTNYEAIVNTLQIFKAGLQKRGGTVAVSGSLFALVPAPFNVSYSQSKLDALNFIKAEAREEENQNIRFHYFVLGPVNTLPGNVLPWWKSLIIPSPEKTAMYIIKHLGGGGLINIFPLNSRVIILLNALLPKAAMNRLMTFLKR